MKWKKENKEVNTKQKKSFKVLTPRPGKPIKCTPKVTETHAWGNLKIWVLSHNKSGLLIFRTVAEPWNSGKSAKSCEIHKNTQNTAKFPRHLIKYMSVHQFWNLSQLLGVLQFTCCKIANLCQNFVTETYKLPGIEYVAKNWALAMMLKALPLFHFMLKEQMMTSVRKTLKTLVWSAQNRSISSEICPANNHKIYCLFTHCFPAKFAPKIPAKLANFSAILSLKIQQNLTFFPRPIRRPDKWTINTV